MGAPANNTTAITQTQLTGTILLHILQGRCAAHVCIGRWTGFISRWIVDDGGLHSCAHCSPRASCRRGERNKISNVICESASMNVS